MVKKVLPFLALLAAIVVPLVVDFGYTMYSLVLVVLYMYWASAWNIMGGYTGLFAIGNGMYAGIGAYATGILFMFHGISPWLGIFIAGIIAGLVSLAVGYPVFRLKGMYYALATIAMMSALKIIFANETVVLGYHTNGANGLQIPVTGRIQDMQFMTKLGYYYVILFLLVVLLLVSNLISKSKMGYYFRAIKADEEAAGSLGVNVLGYKMTSHFISAFFTAIGGGFYAMLMVYVDPKTVFSFDFSVNMLLMAIIGGVGRLWGPILGAGILVPVKEIIRVNLGTKVAGLSAVMYGMVLMFVIYFMPNGILGWISDRISAAKLRSYKAKNNTETAKLDNCSREEDEV